MRINFHGSHMVDEVLTRREESCIVFGFRCGLEKKGKMSINDINDKCQPNVIVHVEF